MGFLADDSGATAIEYGLIAACLTIVIISALGVLGGGNGGMWDNNVTELSGAMSGTAAAED